MMRPRPPCARRSGQDPSQPWGGSGPLTALGQGGGDCKATEPQPRGGAGQAKPVPRPLRPHVCQLSSTPAAPDPGPPACHTALTWKPEAEVGGGDLGPGLGTGGSHLSLLEKQERDAPEFCLSEQICWPRRARRWTLGPVNHRQRMELCLAR